MARLDQHRPSVAFGDSDLVQGDQPQPADMQGIQLMGQTLGTYESQAVKAPVRPEQRSAWRNMPVFNFLR